MFTFNHAHFYRPGGQGPTYVPPHVTELLLRSLESQANDSVQVLEKILSNLKGRTMTMPRIDTFVTLTENSTNKIEHEWLQGYQISTEEFELQLRYDLAVWFMFANQYVSAKNHFQIISKLFPKCESIPMEYCTISAQTLKGFLSACQIQDVETKKSLIERMHESIKNGYIDFLNILQEDNIQQEVPIHYREMAELDLCSAVAGGKITLAKDLIFKVKTLNVVRKTLANRHIPQAYFIQLKVEAGASGVQFFIKVKHIPLCF